MSGTMLLMMFSLCEHYRKDSEVTGGEGIVVIVEIDKTKFRRGKYNKGGRVDNHFHEKNKKVLHFSFSISFLPNMFIISYFPWSELIPNCKFKKNIVIFNFIIFIRTWYQFVSVMNKSTLWAIEKLVVFLPNQNALKKKKTYGTKHRYTLLKKNTKIQGIIRNEWLRLLLKCLN